MIEVNLLPARMVKKRRMGSFFIFMIISNLLVVFLCILLFSFVKKDVESAQGELARVQGEVRKYQPILRELGDLKNKEATLRLRIEALEKLIVSQTPWPLILYEINKSLPDNIWLTELTKAVQGEEQVITLRGYRLKKSVEIGKFMENLNKSSLFKDIVVSDISRSKIGKVEVMEFRISCKLESSL